MYARKIRRCSEYGHFWKKTRVMIQQNLVRIYTWYQVRINKAKVPFSSQDLMVFELPDLSIH